MKNRPFLTRVRNFMLTAVGSAIFALGFDLFLVPNRINLGGVSGLAMLLTEILGFGSIGLFAVVLNVPLFALGLGKLGKKFFFGSALGMAVSSVCIDLFAAIPAPQTETLLGALYGGLMAGLGLGMVFLAGASTGGADILARLLKRRFRSLSIGKLLLGIDAVVVAMTGLAFSDISKALYSAVPLWLSSSVIDALLYGLDDSTVAWIITEEAEAVEQAIQTRLERGVTLLEGRGGYTGKTRTILLSAVSRRQVPELKALTERIDPDAFLILQQAHQVLGEGFKRYSDEL